MIHMNANAHAEPFRPPRGKDYVPHDSVIAALQLRIEERFGTGDSPSVLFSTTLDGMDAVASVELPWHEENNPTARYCLGFVNANSGRQGCYIYAGVCDHQAQWCIVLDRYPLMKRKMLRSMRDCVEDAMAKWSLFQAEYAARLGELRWGTWSLGKTEYLTFEAGRNRLITPARVFCADQLWDHKRDTAFSYLSRMSRVVWRHPPITISPPRNQMGQMYALYRKAVMT